MPDVRLDAGDAAELAGLLQFPGGWLARDPARPGASLAGFTGYGTAQLRRDLDRFTFLPGGDDGESLSGPGAAGVRRVTAASPLRGTESIEGGGFAATHFPAPSRLRGRDARGAQPRPRRGTLLPGKQLNWRSIVKRSGKLQT